MKRILWITATWAYDTDCNIVPYLKKKSGYNIYWLILRYCNDKPITSSEMIDEVLNLNYRNRDVRIIRQLKNTIGKLLLRNDIVYSSNNGYPFYYPTLFWINKKRIPIIHAAHNVIPYPIWPLSLRLFVKYIFRRNNYFQLFSQFTADYFSKHYPQKSFFYAPMVLKDFGPVTTDNYNIDNSKVNLLFFGNIVGNKRLDLLIDAIKELPTEIQDKIHLNICGNCKMNKEQFIRQIGNNKCISTYFKRIPDEEIPELFTKHQYLVLPYEDVAQSGPHMIAYNYNLPVIASNINGFSERVQDGVNGFLFKRNDITCLANTIHRAVSLNKKEYEALKEQLKIYTENNFSIEKVAEKYIKYFKTI